jgi:hypothetical protein
MFKGANESYTVLDKLSDDVPVCVLVVGKDIEAVWSVEFELGNVGAEAETELFVNLFKDK